MAISKIVGYITPGMSSGEKTLQKLIPNLKNAYDWVKVVLPDNFSGANVSASFYITDNIYILCEAFNNSGNTAEMKTYFVTENSKTEINDIHLSGADGNTMYNVIWIFTKTAKGFAMSLKSLLISTPDLSSDYTCYFGKCKTMDNKEHWGCVYTNLNSNTYNTIVDGCDNNATNINIGAFTESPNFKGILVPVIDRVNGARFIDMYALLSTPTSKCDLTIGDKVLTAGYRLALADN